MKRVLRLAANIDDPADLEKRHETPIIDISVAFNVACAIASLSPSGSGNKWPYRSIVIVMLAWPMMVCARFGDNPCSMNSDAAAWRNE